MKEATKQVIEAALNPGSQWTPDLVRQIVDAMRAEAAELWADDVMLHVYQDELALQLILAISDGRCTDQAGCCAEAIKVRDIGFSRWYE